MKAGIYRIMNNVNGKCYIGSSVDTHRRQLQHFSALKNNKHYNTHLQNAYNKYGCDAFEFSVVENIEITENIKDILIEREQFWIDNIHPEYNILPVAGSNLGFNHTEETKEKISKTMTGVKKSEEHAKHIRESQKGRVFTEEHKAKLSEAAKHRKGQSNHAIISIDGVIYNSLKEASQITGVKYNTIQKRLKNPKFPNYFYVKFGSRPPKLNS